MITTQYCAECERLALLAALRAAMKTARENGDAVMVAEYWIDIQLRQRHQHTHTCKGVSHE